MRRPWFGRTSSANDVGLRPNNSKSSTLISASQSVLRLHRNTSKNNQVVRGATKKKLTIQSSRSHLGFLPDSSSADNSDMPRFNRKTGHRLVSDRPLPLPVAPLDTDTDGEDVITRQNTAAHPADFTDLSEFASSGVLNLRRKARPPVPKTTLPSLDPPHVATSTSTPSPPPDSTALVVAPPKKALYTAKRNTHKAIQASKQAAAVDTPSSSPNTGVLEMRLKRRRDALKSNLDAKTSMDPTSEAEPDKLERRRNRLRAADEKQRMRVAPNSSKQHKAAIEPNAHAAKNNANSNSNINSFGVLVRKQPPTPGGSSASGTRTESASSASEIVSALSGPVVKILGRNTTRGGFSSDRSRSGPILHHATATESAPSSARTNRTRSGPIEARRKGRGEFGSEREVKLLPHKGNAANGAKISSNNNNINDKGSGSDSSGTSDDEPTSTPRTASRSGNTYNNASSTVKPPSGSPPTKSPPSAETQSRAESMPHLRRRKYAENKSTPPDSQSPSVCPVIPELPTTKSFQNSSSPNAPASATDSSVHHQKHSHSMASLRRRVKNNTNTHGNDSRNNSQFDADRPGDTPVLPSTSKSAFAGYGSTNHSSGSSSMLRLRRLRNRKNEPKADANHARSDTDQTPLSPPSRYGFPTSKSASRIASDQTGQYQHESHSMLRLRRTKRLHVDADPAMIEKSGVDASPPPPLRYSHADLRISGWLSKKGKRLGTKVERYFTLRGCVLSNARNKGAKSSSSINVRGAKVYGGAAREIVIALPKAVVSFFAPSAESHARWIKALQAVSSSVFDFYDKGKRIGKGAYSEVFLGRDKIRNELCAIKVLQRPDADHGKLIDREISVLHMLNNRNIVQIYDIFATPKTTYIVMEFLPGGELLDMITENDNLSELCAKHVISQLLSAISYLHMKDIVHRDIKPDNILCVGRTWPLHVKLTDFGLSKMVHSSENGLMKSQCGTAFYLAPEIARNLDYGKPVDLWACGIVLYVMLAGKFPFYGDNHKEFIRRLRNGVKFPSKQWKNISPDAKDLILCLLDPNPASRLTADQALQHRWLRNDQEPKSTFTLGGPRNLQTEFNNDLQSMPAVNLKPRRGYRDKSSYSNSNSNHRSSGLTARKRVENIQDLPSFTTSVSTVGDPHSESMVF